MKGIKQFAVVLFLAIAMTFAVFAQTDIRIYVNGNRVQHDVIVKDDRTYIPVRAVSEALGAEVVWDDETRSVFVSFSEDDAVAKIVENVSRSVVSIVGNYSYDKNTDDYNNLIAHGSGVIYKSNGYIVTNAHVVEGLTNITVVLNDGTSLPGKVMYSDSLADLAVVKINKLGLTPVRMASKESIVSGKTAIAIGTPVSLSMRNTVSKGIISGVGVDDGAYYKFLQTDAAINPGNSGGPLVNINGELIGINSAKYVGSSVDNIGLAIPVDTVEFVIKQFETYGKVLRPELSVVLTESWEAKNGIPTHKGLTVKSSENANFLSGDVINSVNGIAVHSIADFNEAVKQTYNGKSLLIEYVRDGVTTTTEIQV